MVFPQRPTITNHSRKDCSFLTIQKCYSELVSSQASTVLISIWQQLLWLPGWSGSLVLFLFHFSNSFSTFLIDPLLGLLLTTCYCVAIFYTWSSLQIPPLPSSESPNKLLCAKALQVHMWSPRVGGLSTPPRLQTQIDLGTYSSSGLS